MQGSAGVPAAPAAEPPQTTQVKTEEVISEAKQEHQDLDVEVKMEELDNTNRRERNNSIDSDNQSDHSDVESRRGVKRPASPSNLEAKRFAKAECFACRLRFDSKKALDLHRYTAHGEEVRGFEDLTFVDFSSRKFPEIARGICERNPHKAITEPRYRCDVCTRDFPCGQALEMHRKTCSLTTRLSSPERDRRDDFFAKLDLKNHRGFNIAGTLTPPLERFVPKFNETQYLSENGRPVDAVRDLADIQSILNVTSAGGLLERLTGTRISVDNVAITPPDTGGKDREEEGQDRFAAEFRRMKLRGEFPCRLCPAKFPNLRALKGHNRVHLSGNGPGPYRCNMCPHASLDKAALVRHMRTHNGDRPYECAVCNYAFTTKANCERHLRNRHAKVTREDVKRSIIYHPSEDPNNDEVNSKICREDVKRSLAFHTPEPERRDESTGRDTPLTHLTSNYVLDKRPVFMTPPVLPETPISTPREPETVVPRIKVKGLGELTQIPEYREPEHFEDDEEPQSYSSEAPVDLSTSDNNDCDVLDLSKKKRDTEDEPPKPILRQTYENDATSVYEKTQRLLLAQRRLFEHTLPKLDPTFYATQLSQLCSGGVPGLPGLPLPPSFPMNPYFLQPPFFPPATDPQEFSEMKERIQKEIIRGLRLSGGGLVNSEIEQLPSRPESVEDQKPPLALTPPMQQRPESPRRTPILPQTDAVKMVIKNGVLMPKQKQRRYRTERPFSCSQCSARFTLRSNMERHVKQQHPQHWSVRRPSPRAPPPYATPDTLAESVKFALLARQLQRPADRSPVRRDSDEVADNEEDEDDALIIDEETEENSDHTAAHRAAAEILLASRQQELAKDFDLKIAGNLINKPQPIPVVEKNEATDLTMPVASPPSSTVMPVSVVPARSDEEEDEEGLVASTSEGNNSGSDENSSLLYRSEADANNQPPKKKSAYSLAPNRVSCPYCHRKFPWSSSLRRHVLTHTGQKPFKCPHCPLLFTTKSNCDRHLLRKHGGSAKAVLAEPIETLPPQDDPNLRNVPERPFKCLTCPSSTFSTVDNLKKHMTLRHGCSDNAGSPNEEDNLEDQELPEIVDGPLAFKCHLCEGSFGDRENTLRHLASSHVTEYEQLVSKGALDAASDKSESADDDERGKFPDHANRKVVCAFCIRRFWSAEDLRRHMRTHSGERPFACDLCSRRFTLKHSMLRHRKKHRDEPTDDEEPTPPDTPNQPNGYSYGEEDGSGNEIPNNINNNNSPPSTYAKKYLNNPRKYSSEDGDLENGGDLIEKLLDISDKGIINKLIINKLSSKFSADEAAELLEVKK